MNAESRRVLLVDDHQFVRMALAHLLSEVRGVVGVDEAASLGDAVTAIGATRYDLVLLDLDLPDSTGLDSFFSLSASCPEVAVAIVTGDCSVQIMAQAMQAGARGFIAKTQSPGVIQAAVALMLAGERFVPASLYLAENSRVPEDRGQTNRTTRMATAPDLAGLEEMLSPRLIDVLRLIVEGKSNREISMELSLSPGTVKNYVAALFERLGQPDRRRMIRYVTQLQSRRRTTLGAQ